MKRLIACVFLLGLTACGEATYKTRLVQGPKGEAGSSCSVSRVGNGALVACSDGTYAMISDGAKGADGAPAALNPNDIVEIINPCGDGPGFDEVLLRLRSGQVLAHYASGANQFLVILTPGSYVTTDGQSCRFSLAANGQVSF